MSKAKTVMLQGTSSHVGKSLLCTALCRIFSQDGYKVAPFKAQNMALNTYITPNGEMGYAQATQAEAAGILPECRMNPILLKPKGDMTSDVIVMGKYHQTMGAMEYRNKFLPQGEKLVAQCISSLKEDFDLVVIEGAGSPVEINLRDRDIVNMKTAELADAPVLLVADIDRGGVFAAIIGTLDLLRPKERQRVKGLIINKFRGDIQLLYPGIDFLEKMTGLPVLGVIPYLPNHHIPQEDSLVLAEKPPENKIDAKQLDIAVIKLPRIANFTDFEVLKNFPDTVVRFVSLDEPLGSPDMIILPSTKTVMEDLQNLWQSGMAWQIIELHANGAAIVGIGGGYQMLGEKLEWDSQPIGEEKSLPGLGFLDMRTLITITETVGQQHGKVVGKSGFWSQVTAQDIIGYQVDCGRISYGPMVEPVIETVEKVVGVGGPGTDVWGTTLHGIFKNVSFTLCLINHLRHKKGLSPLQEEQLQHLQSNPYNRLASHVRQHLNMEKIYQIIGVE